MARENGVAAWSAAFDVVLEKRGWLSVDLATFADIEGPEDLAGRDMILVAWRGERDMPLEKLAWLQAAATPLVIEGPIGAEEAKALGLAASAAVDPTAAPSLDIVEPALAAALGQACPHTVGDRARASLERKGVVSREMTFDFIGARFRAGSATTAPEAAAHAIIGQIYGQQNRFGRLGWIFEKPDMDLQAAAALWTVRSKLDGGRYSERFRAFIETFAAASLERQGDGFEAPARADWDAFFADLPTAPGVAQVRLKLEARLQCDPAAKPADFVAAAGAASLTNYAAALAELKGLDATGVADAAFLELRDALYDPQKGGFRNGKLVDGAVEVAPGYSGHPTFLRALATFSGPIEIPHAGEAATATMSAVQRAVWDRPPERCQSFEGASGAWVPLARFADGAPAVVRRGDCVVTGAPVLAWATHYHTIGPQEESYGDGAALGFMAVEELLFLLLDDLAKRARRPVPRIAPWPWSKRYSLTVRHDVDRIPDAETFERLMSLHVGEGLGVSWYWLPWRLDGEQMRRQAEAGHEIALHSVRTGEKRWEIEQVACAADGRPRFPVTGEAFHGTAADFWVGAPSVEASVASGLRYTEYAPNMFQFPYAAFPVLTADGAVGRVRGGVGLTQNASADSSGFAAAGPKSSLVGNPDFVQEWIGRGHPVVIVNHPDLNFDRLREIVLSFPEDGRLDWTAAQVADWWRRTHQATMLRAAWIAQDSLEVVAREPVEDLCLILPESGYDIIVDGQPPPARDVEIVDGTRRLRLSLSPLEPRVVSLR